MIVQVADGPIQEIGPGSYIFLPGGTPHTHTCKPGVACVIFVQQEGAGGSLGFGPPKNPLPWVSFVPVRKTAYWRTETLPSRLCSCRTFTRSTITRGRPKVLPSFLALCNPAVTRSWVMLRSNSATAPNTVNQSCNLRVASATHMSIS